MKIKKITFYKREISGEDDISGWKVEIEYQKHPVNFEKSGKTFFELLARIMVLSGFHESIINER